jgi:hypothetical protein
VPQPWHSGPLYIYFNALPATERVRCRIFTVAGELAMESWAQGPDGRVAFDDAAKLSSGVYLADTAWMRENAVYQRVTVKVAITH